MEQSIFGITKKGQEATLYTLKNSKGMEITVSDFGAVLTKVLIPDSVGKKRDVVLGYGSLKEYENNTDTYFGSTVGRNANRLEGASVTCAGTKYQMIPNDGDNNLHSGPDGYQVRMWDVLKEAEQGNSVRFVLESPNGDQGFPGNLKITVSYTLTEDNEIIITYSGISDAETVFNPTNHTYFNLGGHSSGTILNHQLTLYADVYTPVVDSASIPTGETTDVSRTPMDFREAKEIGRDIDAEFNQLLFTGGYDHNFVLDKKAGMKKAVLVECRESGIVMEACTDRPGIQFYTGNFLKNEPGKDGAVYGKRCGFCLETQYFPNAANEPAFESPIIRANEPCETKTIYRFISKGLEKDGGCR